jgi:MFS family permease
VSNSSILRPQNRSAWPSPQGQYLAAAFVLFLVLFGGNLPTPLYPVWHRQFGLSTGTVTVVYALYPLGVVLGLLFGGRLADQLGRRPIVALAALASVLAEACFIVAGSVGLLFAGRRFGIDSGLPLRLHSWCGHVRDYGLRLVPLLS